MRGRRLRWGLALGGLVALIVASFVAWHRRDRITQENFNRIAVGMTQAEVEAILGRPENRSGGFSGILRSVRWSTEVEESANGGGGSPWPVTYRKPPLAGRTPRPATRKAGIKWSDAWWQNDRHMICLIFDSDGKAVRGEYFDLTRLQASPPRGNVLRRPWRRWFPED